MISRGVVGVALIVSLLLLLAGCASTGMSREEHEQAVNAYIEKNKLPAVDRVSAFRLDSWSELNNRQLLISVSVNRPYLVILRSDCYDLDHSMTIQIHNMGSQLRPKFDAISVPGQIQQRCYIEKIYKLTREQKKELLSIRKDAKEKQGEAVSEQS